MDLCYLKYSDQVMKYDLEIFSVTVTGINAFWGWVIFTKEIRSAVSNKFINAVNISALGCILNKKHQELAE